MADFCNKCSNEMFGPKVEPEIDVHKILVSLDPGYYTNVICEGCAMVAIIKEEDGSVKLGYAGENEDEIVYGTLEEWEAKGESLKY